MAGQRKRTEIRRLHVERMENRCMLAATSPFGWNGTNPSLTKTIPSNTQLSVAPAAIRSNLFVVQLTEETIGEWRSFETTCVKLKQVDSSLEVVRGLGKEGLVLVRVKGNTFNDQVLSLYKLKVPLTSTPKPPQPPPRVRYFAPERAVDSDETADADPPTASPVTTDEYASEQWGMSKINVGGAWSAGSRGNRSAVVAVIDTGVDFNHPDLRDNIWTNENESGVQATDRIDNDSNDYVDDVRGWDFVDDDNDPSDGNSHGTRVAGIIAAVADNKPSGQSTAIGISGVAPGVRILPLRVFDETGLAELSAVTRSLYYCVWLRDEGVNIVAINNSYSYRVLPGAYDGYVSDQTMIDGLISDEQTIFQQAVAAVTGAGMVFVASAGNAGRNIDDLNEGVQYPAAIVPNPASIDAVIAVAASTTTTSGGEARLPSSNWGQTNVDLYAPGGAIWSLLAGGGYGASSGSSMAAAFVTGTVALVRLTNPSLSAAEAKNVILSSVDADPSFVGSVATGGRLNAAKAVEKAKKTVSTPAVTCFYDPSDARLDIRGTAGKDLVTVVRNTTMNAVEVSSRVGANESVILSLPISTQPVGRIYFVGGFSDDTFNNGTDIRSEARGGPGNDTLSGGSNSDLLYGDGGDDTLDGRGGVDRLYGGLGADTLKGGRDADVLIVDNDDRYQLETGDRKETPAKAGDTSARRFPRRPFSLDVSVVSLSEVQVSWSPAARATAYRLRYRDAQGDEKWISPRVVGIAVTTMTLKGLAPEKTYELQIRAENGVGSSAWRFATVSTHAGVLSAPGRPELVARTTDGFRIRWQDNSVGETSFLVEVSLDGQSWNPVETVFGKNECTVSGLDSGTLYRVRVTALGTGAPSAPSRERQIATASLTNQGPAAPSNPIVSSVGEKSFSLSWTRNSSNEDGFEVWVARSGGSFALSERVDANRTTALIGNEKRNGPKLEPNKPYQVKLRAYRNGDVYSAFTDAIPLTTADNRPAAPSNPIVSSVGEKSFSLSWTRNSSNEDGFEVWVARSGGSFALSERVGVNGTTAVIENEKRDGPKLEPNKPYQVKLRAYRDGGIFSAFTEAVSLTTADNRPAAPSAPIVSSVGENSFRLSWTRNSSNEDGFEVWVARSGGGFALSERVPANGTTALIEYEKQNGSRLDPNKPYQVKLRAYRNGGVYSAFTDAIPLTTADNRPAAPSRLRASGVGSQSFNLSWNDNSGNEAKFQVYIRKSSNNDWYRSEDVSQDREAATIDWFKAKESHLARNTSYVVRMRAVKADGTASAWSSELTVKTTG